MKNLKTISSFLKTLLFALILCGFVSVPEKIYANTSGSEDFSTAPSLELGVTYSFDSENYNSADLNMLKNGVFYYYKFIVQHKGIYQYKFKFSTPSSSRVRLYDSDYNQIAGTSSYSYDSLSTLSGELSLKEGEYYIGIYTSSSSSEGSVYLAPKTNMYTDLQFNVNEQIYSKELAEELNGTDNFNSAPRIQLGETYSFDNAGFYSADLSTSKNDCMYFYKYIIESKGVYEYKFKFSSPSSSRVRLYDSDYNQIAGTSSYSYDSLSTLSGELSLKEGVYYIGIYTSQASSVGSLYLAPRSANTYTDLQYNVSEPINTSSISNGLTGTCDFYTAPRIQLGETYTFDNAGFNNANLSTDQNDRMYFYKFLIKYKGVYTYNFKFSSSASSRVRLYDSDYNQIAGTSSYSYDSLSTLNGKLSLEKGVYYIGIYTSQTASTGNIYLSLPAQTITVSETASKPIKYSSVKKASKSILIDAKAKGSISYKVTKGSKYLSVSSSGKVNVKKGTPKGTYKVSIIAKETDEYAKTIKNIEIVVK